ncbi:MAG: hypothetical protein ACTHYN_01640 [Marinobacter sp.]|uniref:hypothetical protein n=1 Tax=Marinobacter sp. TaxID=50741 RepID=UPI003F9E443D
MTLIPRYLSVLAIAATPATADVFQFAGAAENPDGEALYEEQHRIEGACENGVFQPKTHSVLYVRQADEGSETFAEKELDYSRSDTRPTVNYQQPDFQESLKISYADTSTANIAWQQPNGDKMQTSVDVSEDLVVDAGFDNFVRQNWNKIVNGDSIRFRFLVPARGASYSFILEPAPNPPVNAEHLVQIRPDNVFLTLLVDPITLGYNNKAALVAYSGLTNVRKNADENYTATIRYTVSHYPECDLTP